MELTTPLKTTLKLNMGILMKKFIVRFGENGDEVKLVQELLNLNDYDISINGIYDEETKNIVKKFQQEKNLKEIDGEIIDMDDYLMLIKPLEVAKAKLPRSNTIHEMIVVYAYHHLAQNPRDIGGNNCGP
jgi:peptidoglycan hydrolase-like protein with peptidoglycan-binding domain